MAAKQTTAILIAVFIVTTIMSTNANNSTPPKTTSKTLIINPTRLATKRALNETIADQNVEETSVNLTANAYIEVANTPVFDPFSTINEAVRSIMAYKSAILNNIQALSLDASATRDFWFQILNEVAANLLPVPIGEILAPDGYTKVDYDASGLDEVPAPLEATELPKMGGNMIGKTVQFLQNVKGVMSQKNVTSMLEVFRPTPEKFNGRVEAIKQITPIVIERSMRKVAAVMRNVQRGFRLAKKGTGMVVKGLRTVKQFGANVRRTFGEMANGWAFGKGGGFGGVKGGNNVNAGFNVNGNLDLGGAKHGKWPWKREVTIESTNELITRWGYKTRRFIVQTDDGYLLAVDRIYTNRNGDESRMGPVILQHGIVASSDAFVLQRPDRDLAFILADRGYDVWIMNTRGNMHSRRHVFLSPDDRRFWDFGIHETSIYDLPAVIDFILMKTNRKKVFYIGYSVGSYYFYIMCSMRPEYSDKIQLSMLMGPIVYMKLPASIQKLGVDLSEPFTRTLEKRGKYECFAFSEANYAILNALCGTNSPTQSVCIELLFAVVGRDFQQANMSLYSEILKHFPAGTSTKSVDHTRQIFDTGEFKQFDYGERSNLAIYGRSTPPEYDISKINTPVALYYAPNDGLVSEESVVQLERRSSNVVQVYQVNYAMFNHLDFMWGRDANQLLYEPMIQLMDKYKLP